MELSREKYVSGPFSSIGNNGKPSWSILAPSAGNFMPVNAINLAYQEVLYDEGGYGDGGYDTPSHGAQDAPLPNWVKGSSE